MGASIAIVFVLWFLVVFFYAVCYLIGTAVEMIIKWAKEEGFI